VLAVTEKDLHFAIVSGAPSGPSFSVTSPIVYGTAFPLLPGLLATAGHVLKAAASDGKPAAVRLEVTEKGVGFDVRQLSAWEIFDDIDFALMLCPGLIAHPICWPVSFEPLPILQDVSALGFPAAVDPEHLAMVIRGFKGHVVTRRRMLHVKGQPPGYELSMPAPRGLSGAPLVSFDPKNGNRCHGYVVQQMHIDASGEDPGTPVAIAIDSSIFLSIKTKLVPSGVLASVWEQPFKPLSPKMPVTNPMLVQPDHSLEGWPDDDLPSY
jgi:hypothetical protein